MHSETIKFVCIILLFVLGFILSLFKTNSKNSKKYVFCFLHFHATSSLCFARRKTWVCMWRIHFCKDFTCTTKMSLYRFTEFYQLSYREYAYNIFMDYAYKYFTRSFLCRRCTKRPSSISAVPNSLHEKKVMQPHWFTDTQQVRLNGWENLPLQLRMTMSESVHQGLIAQ